VKEPIPEHQSGILVHLLELHLQAISKMAAVAFALGE
jgi:hypothetical protein